MLFSILYSRDGLDNFGKISSDNSPFLSLSEFLVEILGFKSHGKFSQNMGPKPGLKLAFKNKLLGISLRHFVRPLRR